MTFTGQLGTSNSQLGQIVLGVASSGGNVSDVGVTSTLTLAQTIHLATVLERTIVQTVTLVSTLSNITKNTISQNITFTETIGLIKQNNTDIHSTFTMTQTIGLNTVLNRTVSQTLTMTSSPSRDAVLNLDVSQTITFTGSILKIAELSVSDSITFTQLAAISQSKVITQTLALTQDVTHANVISRTIMQTIIYNQSQTQVGIKNKTVSQTLTITETQVNSKSRAVNQTITFTQTQTAIVAKRISQQLTITQDLSRIFNPVRTVNTLFIPFQTIVRTHLANLSTSNTLTMAQDVIVYKVKPVNQTLNLTQQIDNSNSKLVDNLFIMISQQTRNVIYNLSVPEIVPHGEFPRPKLHLTQSILLNKSYSLSVNSAFGINSLANSYRVISPSVSQAVTFNEEVRRIVTAAASNQLIDLSQSISVSKIVTANISQVLTLADAVNVNITLNFNLAQNLTFLNTHPQQLSDFIIDVPNILVAKSQRFTLFKAKNSVVVLPNPEFGDGEGNTGLFTVRRAINGKSYTYVKNTKTRKLNYQFFLGRRYALSLKEFLRAHHSDLIEMQNWKGEIWKVFITNNPVEFTAKSPYGTCETDRYDISLELEGVRIN